MRRNTKNKIRGKRLKDKKRLSPRQVRESLIMNLKDKDEVISNLQQALAAKEDALIAKEDAMIAKEEIIISRTQELNGIYGSTGYRYLLKPLWVVLWAIKVRLKFTKNVTILYIKKLQSLFFAFLALIKRVVGRGIKMSRGCYFALTTPSTDLRKIYLRHVRCGTFPPVPTRFTLGLVGNRAPKVSSCGIHQKTKTQRSLTQRSALKIIDKAAHMGVKELLIAGGDPLSHPHLFEIVAFARDKNLKTALITKGFLLKQNVKNILESGISYLQVSIGEGEDSDGSWRKFKGEHKDMLDAIERIRQHRIPVTIDFAVTSKNINKLEDVYNYFSIRNIKLNLRPAVNMPEALILKAPTRQVFLRFIKRLFIKGDISNHDYDYLKKAVSFSDRYTRVRCLGLNSEFSVDSSGNVSACCVAANGKARVNGLGNILKEDLEKLWFSPEYQKRRASIFSKGCENCFNPSIAELTKSTGVDYLVEESRYPRHLIPNRVHFRFTSRCNLTCRHCDIWKGPRDGRCNKELTVQQWKLIIDKLSDWLGRFKLDLAGGEILLYGGALDLIDYCTGKKISANLTTNATLINEEVAKRLMSSGLYGINLSLDGLPGHHNYIRNREDAYHKVRLAAHNLLMHRKRHMPYVNLTAVITKYNLDDLNELVHCIHNWGIDGIGFQALDHMA